MAAFHYRAVDPSGRAHRGVIEAPSPAAAREALRARALLPLVVEGGASRTGDGAAAPARRHRLSGRDLALITRQLSTLVASDVRIDAALTTIAAQSGPRVAALVLTLRTAVVEGRSLGAALDDHPGAFGEYYRASVGAGETSGRLAEVLAHLADFVETRQRNAQSVQLALLYPALLALVSVGIVLMLLVFVVPDIVRVFAARGADLPLITRGLIGLADGVGRYGLATVLALAGLGVALRLWAAQPGGRLRLHRATATLPVLGRFVGRIHTAQFAGTLATLLQSGVPLVEALRAAAAAIPNLHLRNLAQAAAARVREGASLTAALTESGQFPPMLRAMVASGEGSGRLGPVLAQAAADQQRALDAQIATLVALVEPGVLLVMGGLVLAMVLAILMPIVSLNDLAGL